MIDDIQTDKQRLLIKHKSFENPALPRVLIITSAVYPRLVVNYDFNLISQ